MLNPLLYKNLSYRPRDDFEPITLAAFVDHVIIMHRSVPAKDLHEMVEFKPIPTSSTSDRTGPAPISTS